MAELNHVLSSHFPAMGGLLPPTSIPRPTSRIAAAGPPPSGSPGASTTPTPLPLTPRTFLPFSGMGVIDLESAGEGSTGEYSVQMDQEAVEELAVSPELDPRVPIASEAIAKYSTAKLASPCGASISCTPQMICYVIKGSNIRVIETGSGARVLLKRHAEAILDLTLAPVPSPWTNNASVLASGGKDGLLTIWDIPNTQSLTKQGEIDASLAFTFAAPNATPVTRVVFQPQSSLLLVAHGSEITGLLVGHALGARLGRMLQTGYNPETGALNLVDFASMTFQGLGSAVTDMSFSSDGGRVVVGRADGSVTLYNLPPTLGSTAVQVPIARRLPTRSSAPVSSVTFLGLSDELLITGQEGNSRLDVWSGGDVVIQKIHFTASTNELANRVHRLTRTHLVVVDSNSPSMAVLSLASPHAGFKRALVFRLANPVHAANIDPYAQSDKVIMHVADQVLIQTLSINSLAQLFSLPPTQRVVATGTTKLAQGAPLPSLSPQYPQQDPNFSPSNQLPSVAAPFSSVKPASSGAPGASFELAMEKRFAELTRHIDETMKARDAAERERSTKLLESINTVLSSLAENVADTVALKLGTNPTFADEIASRVAEKSTEKSSKTLLKIMPTLVQSASDQVVHQLQPVIQQAFQDVFVKRLVPSFEAGCGDLLAQLKEAALAGRAAPVAAEAAASGGDSAQEILARVVQALQANDVQQALDLAVAASKYPSILDQTCRAADLVSVVQTTPLPVTHATLLRVLKRLSAETQHAEPPGGTLEIITAVTVALGEVASTNRAIRPLIVEAAREAKKSLDANAAALLALPAPVPKEFQALLYILTTTGYNNA